MAKALAIIFGAILLLPGACALGFMGLSVTLLPGLGSADWNGVGQMAVLAIPLWLVCFAISFGGIMLLRSGFRK